MEAARAHKNIQVIFYDEVERTFYFVYYNIIDFITHFFPSLQKDLKKGI